MNKKFVERITKELTSVKRENLIANICYINGLIKKYNLGQPKLRHSGKELHT